MPTIIPVVSVSDDLPLSGGETVPSMNIYINRLRVSLVEQELLTTPELLSSSAVFSVDHVATYLVF
jgi:hypothetical protein